MSNFFENQGPIHDRLNSLLKDKDGLVDMPFHIEATMTSLFYEQVGKVENHGEIKVVLNSTATTSYKPQEKWSKFGVFWPKIFSLIICF